MTISTTASKQSFLCNGATSSFAFSFPGVAAAYIIVTYTDASGNITTLATTDYTVTLNAPASGSLWGIGGTVTYLPGGSAPPNGAYVTIQRVLPEQQSTPVSSQTALYLSAIEQALDTLAMQVQQLQEQLGRVPIAPVGDPPGLAFEYPGAASRANLLAGFGSDGGIIATAGPLTGTNVSAAMAPVVSASTLASAMSTLGITAAMQPVVGAASLAAAQAAMDLSGAVYQASAYGIVADGSTDNATALQTLIDDVIGYATGAVIQLPAGIILLGSTVTIRGFDLTIQGAGYDKTVFKPKTSGTRMWQIGSASDPNPWTGTKTFYTAAIRFQDITFDTTSKNAPVANIDPSAETIQFWRCNFVSDYAGSTIFDQSNEPLYAFCNFYSSNSSNWGVQWDTWGHGQLMTGCLFWGQSGSGGSGVRITQGAYSAPIVSVSSITRSSTTATVTTSTAHGYTTGNVIDIIGASQSAYNGAQTITVTGTTTFTFTVAGSPTTPATGTITCSIDPRAVAYRVEGASIQNCTFLAGGAYDVQIGNSLYTAIQNSILDQAATNCVQVGSNADHWQVTDCYVGSVPPVSGKVGVLVLNTAGMGGIIADCAFYNLAYGIATQAPSGGNAPLDLTVKGCRFAYISTNCGYFDSVGKLVLIGNTDHGGEVWNDTNPSDGTFSTASTSAHSTIIAVGNMMCSTAPNPYDSSATLKTAANVGPTGYWGN